MKNYNMKNYDGLKWKELTEEEKQEMLKDANFVDETGNNIKESGECIIDLKHPYSIAGRVDVDEDIIVIDDDAVIYNPTDIIGIRTLETGEIIEIGMVIKFGELVDKNCNDGEETLENGCVRPNDDNIIEFEIVKKDEKWWNTLVEIKDIY